MSLKGKFITITGDMIENTGLKGNELLLYALINGFSQDNESWFYGSLSYIQKWLGISKKNTILLLQRLVDKGFIEKKEIVENKVKRCLYRCIATSSSGVETTPGGGVKTTPGVVSKRHQGGGVEKTPYIYNNIDKNIINNILYMSSTDVIQKNTELSDVSRCHDSSMILDVQKEKNTSLSSCKKSSKGSRISENWRLSDTERQYAVSKGLDAEEIERQAELFLNYWLSKSGATAVKKDWTRTWYTWVLTYIDRYQKSKKSNRYGKENQMVNAFENNKKLLEQIWANEKNQDNQNITTFLNF